MHPLTEALTAATRASITLPHSERPLFIGKHLLVQVQNAETLATATSASGTATISKAALQQELAALAKILTTALNAVSGLSGSALQRLAVHLIAEFGGASDTATAHAIATARPNSLDDGDGTNLDDIDDDDDAERPTVAQEAEAEAEAKAAGKRLAGIVRVRGGGCAASKPRAQAEPFIRPVQAEPFIQDLDGPLSSPSLTVEQGAEAAPEEAKAAEPVPEMTDSGPTEVVEPAAGAATEAGLAAEEVSAETRNPIFEIGYIIFDAVVQAFTPRGPSELPKTLNDADDTNLDDIDDDDDAERPPMAIGPPPEMICVLSGLDDRLAEALRAGDIKLLRVSWLRRLRGLLRQPDWRSLRRRQELEALRAESPFLSTEEAVALLRRGNRGVGALTHGWLSPGECDPDGARLDMVLAALDEHPHIEGVFWDYASLFQNLPDRERTPDERAAFARAIKVMADVYASAVGTTVLQSREIPPRPESFDGALCLFGLKTGEAAIRETLGCFGAIVKFELSRNPPVVRFASHEAALAAKRAGPWPELCDGVDTLYNERPYDERGWCVFENAVSYELLARLGAVPRVLEALDALPSKVLVLRSGQPTEPGVAPAGQLETRVAEVVSSIERATFTGKGDKDTVPTLYRDYVARIVGVVESVLMLAAEAATGSKVPLPLMPAAAAGVAAMRAWHLDCLRLQHAFIPDALSGFRLNTLTQCVPIGVEGHDADGKPLAVRDARSLCVLLQGLHASASPCALLTAGPAAGKTWLMSQLIMHSIDGDLLPILVEVQRLQKALAEHEAAFAAAPDWVDAYLRLTCAPDHYGLLRAAMDARRALVLLDGLDEAGRERARIEAHVTTVLAPRKLVLLCTSRPTGLDEALFQGFHRLKLAPLSDAQQAAFLATRLTPTRAAALVPYLRDRVPLDAETRLRVTCNPLMLSMVTSIAVLRADIAMPTRTAELYDVAARAMLARGGALPEADMALLQATFFEAHAAQQRVITAAHLDAAARQLGCGAEALRARVLQDRLPLLRVLQEAPLQMQAFHLSFQEFYAMRALADGSGRALANFRVGDPWWTNAVLMGVQEGDAFGERFVEAAGLGGAVGEGWRGRLVTALAHAGLPSAWLPIVAEAAGAPAEYPRLKRFVGRYRDVLQREGGKAVAQLALQQPQTSVVLDLLQRTPLQRLVVWRNKPLTDDPCVATFAHEGRVSAVAVSSTRIVGGAGKVVYVYDADSEELLKQLEGTSDVTSVAIFEDEQGGLITAGYEDGTIKVWDSGAPEASKSPLLGQN